MAVDWDAMVLAPLGDVFGEGDPADSSTWPTYTPQGGTAFGLEGAVFDDGFQADTLISADGIPEFQTVNPVLGVRLALFPTGVEPIAGDQVVIPSEGKTYLVNEVKPDGKGWARLELALKAS